MLGLIPQKFPQLNLRIFNQFSYTKPLIIQHQPGSNWMSTAWYVDYFVHQQCFTDIFEMHLKNKCAILGFENYLFQPMEIWCLTNQ